MHACVLSMLACVWVNKGMHVCGCLRLMSGIFNFSPSSLLRQDLVLKPMSHQNGSSCQQAGTWSALSRPSQARLALQMSCNSHLAFMWVQESTLVLCLHSQCFNCWTISSALSAPHFLVYQSFFFLYFFLRASKSLTAKFDKTKY